MVLENGAESYDGMWNNDEKVGQGNYLFPYLSICIIGTFFFSSGDKYTGEWEGSITYNINYML